MKHAAISLSAQLLYPLNESLHLTLMQVGDRVVLPNPQAYLLRNFVFLNVWPLQKHPYLWRSLSLWALVFSGSFLIDLILPIFYALEISQNIYFITSNIPF